MAEPSEVSYRSVVLPTLISTPSILFLTLIIILPYSSSSQAIRQILSLTQFFENKRKEMSDKFQLLLLLSLLCFAYVAKAKSVIEPCNSSASCYSLLSYLLPWDSKLSEIATRFQLNISDILAANSIDPTTTYVGNQIIPAKSLVKVPIMCPCVDGIRRSLSTTYTVKAADTVETITEGYGGLVSGDQLRSVNGGKGVGDGPSLVIPLPCSCFGNANNGATAVYMSYVVQRGESLGSIGARYGTTVTDLAAVNDLGWQVTAPGDILAIPIPG